MGWDVLGGGEVGWVVVSVGRLRERVFGVGARRGVGSGGVFCGRFSVASLFVRCSWGVLAAGLELTLLLSRGEGLGDRAGKLKCTCFFVFGMPIL